MDVITFPENRQTTSGLQILLHGVISLQDATSNDKRYKKTCFLMLSEELLCFEMEDSNATSTTSHVQFHVQKCTGIVFNTFPVVCLYSDLLSCQPRVTVTSCFVYNCDVKHKPQHPT